MIVAKVSKFAMSQQSYGNVLTLFGQYRAAGEPLEHFVETKCGELDTSELEMFVLLARHDRFLEHLTEHFVRVYKLRNYNQNRIMVFMFWLMFSGCEQLDIYAEAKCAFKRKLLEFFTQESNLMSTALIGCKHFEDDYVIKVIVQPLLAKAEFMKFLDRHLEHEQSLERLKKPPTVPDHLNVLKRPKPVPVAPLNTPVRTQLFQATKVPKSIYTGDEIEKKLASEHEKNRMRAQKLLQEAKNIESNYCKIYERPKPEVTTLECQFKAKKPPNLKQQVGIKSTVATVLREANLCIKEQEQEIKQIESIMKGGFTLEKHNKLEEDARKMEQEQFLEQVERKHLEGLLTFEEAILAKKKHIACNREKFKKFMEEREEFLAQIEEWKLQEQEKLKCLVKKGQDVKISCKESEKRLKEDKKSVASKIKDETKKMLHEAYERKQLELKQKIKLIEEIKTLHQLRTMDQSKTEPVEPPNLGLLCQMSLKELEENVLRAKEEMRLELERKRRCIRLYRAKRQEMVDNVKNFIAQSRMSKTRKSVPKAVNLERREGTRKSQQLDRLRSQLERVREQRKKIVVECSQQL